MTEARRLSPAHERLLTAMQLIDHGQDVRVMALVPHDAKSVQNLKRWALVEYTRVARQATWYALRARAPGPGFLVIRLTRHIQPRGRDFDDDNLARALKPYRDSVAEWLGIDDGSERLTWLVDQVRDGTRGVTVEVWVRP